MDGAINWGGCVFDLLFLRIEAELFGNQVRTAQLEIAPCCTKRYFRAVSVDFIAFSSVFSKCGASTLLVVIFLSGGFAIDCLLVCCYGMYCMGEISDERRVGK